MRWERMEIMELGIISIEMQGQIYHVDDEDCFRLGSSSSTAIEILLLESYYR